MTMSEIATLNSNIHKTKPFWLKKTSNKAVLFIHAFSSSPAPMNGFADVLAKRGIAVKSVVLPGHCSHPDELLKYAPEDWYFHAKEALAELARFHKEVYIVGVSFGGNLALDLAITNKDKIAGILCIETPAWIKNQIILRTAMFFTKPFKKYWAKSWVESTEEQGWMDQDGVYKKVPISTTWQVLNYIDAQRKRLGKVRVPTLLVQSKNSNLVSPENAEYILDQLSAPKKEIFWIDTKDHSFFSHQEKEKVFRKALEFFEITDTTAFER